MKNGEKDVNFGEKSVHFLQAISVNYLSLTDGTFFFLLIIKGEEKRKRKRKNKNNIIRKRKGEKIVAPPKDD